MLPWIMIDTDNISRKQDTFIHSDSLPTGKINILISSMTRFISREPKNRATWLKIWYKNIEDVEKDNPWALAFNEEEEQDMRTL